MQTEPPLPFCGGASCRRRCTSPPLFWWRLPSTWEPPSSTLRCQRGKAMGWPVNSRNGSRPTMMVAGFSSSCTHLIDRGRWVAPGTNHSFVPSHEVGLAGLIAVPATATFLDFRFRWTCPKSLWWGEQRRAARGVSGTWVVPSRAAVLGWCWYLLPRVGPQGSPCEPDGCGYNKQRRVGQSYPVWFCVCGKKGKRKRRKTGSALARSVFDVGARGSGGAGTVLDETVRRRLCGG